VHCERPRCCRGRSAAGRLHRTATAVACVHPGRYQSRRAWPKRTGIARRRLGLPQRFPPHWQETPSAASVTCVSAPRARLISPAELTSLLRPSPKSTCVGSDRGRLRPGRRTGQAPRQPPPSASRRAAGAARGRPGPRTGRPPSARRPRRPPGPAPRRCAPTPAHRPETQREHGRAFRRRGCNLPGAPCASAARGLRRRCGSVRLARVPGRQDQPGRPPRLGGRPACERAMPPAWRARRPLDGGAPGGTPGGRSRGGRGGALAAAPAGPSSRRGARLVARPAPQRAQRARARLHLLRQRVQARTGAGCVGGRRRGAHRHGPQARAGAGEARGAPGLPDVAAELRGGRRPPRAQQLQQAAQQALAVARVLRRPRAALPARAPRRPLASFLRCCHQRLCQTDVLEAVTLLAQCRHPAPRQTLTHGVGESAVWAAASGAGTPAALRRAPCFRPVMRSLRTGWARRGRAR